MTGRWSFPASPALPPDIGLATAASKTRFLRTARRARLKCLPWVTRLVPFTGTGCSYETQSTISPAESHRRASLGTETQYGPEPFRTWVHHDDSSQSEEHSAFRGE